MVKALWKALGVALVIVAIVVPLVAYTPLSAGAENGDEANGTPIIRDGNHWRVRSRRFFIKHAVPLEVEGELTAHMRRLLLLNVEGEEISVIVPHLWLMNGEVLKLEKLFEEGYLNLGDELVIEALKAECTNEEGVNFYVIFGYEIVNQTNGSHLYAVLPFNIQITE